MHRCYVPRANWAAGILALPPAEAHHLLHVLRATEGEAVVVFDGAGQQARATVGRSSAAGVELRLLEPPHAVAAGAVELRLYQAIPKGPRMDLVIEKATELGAARIVPVLTQRVIVRLDPPQAAARVARWMRIAAAAAKQCGTPRLPEVSAVQPFETALREAATADCCLAGLLSGQPQPLRDVVRAAAARPTPPRHVALLIGPEGDFTPAEAQAILAAGAVPVSFGARVLRTDTAALFGLSVLAAEFLAD